MAAIHVEEAALNTLRGALETAGQDYKRNLVKLTNLIEEITSGDIQGDVAEVLKAKFNEKEPTLRHVLSTIEEAEEYMGLKTTQFDNMISDASAGMR